MFGGDLGIMGKKDQDNSWCAVGVNFSFRLIIVLSEASKIEEGKVDPSISASPVIHNGVFFQVDFRTIVSISWLKVCRYVEFKACAYLYIYLFTLCSITDIFMHEGHT